MSTSVSGFHWQPAQCSRTTARAVRASQQEETEPGGVHRDVDRVPVGVCPAAVSVHLLETLKTCLLLFERTHSVVQATQSQELLSYKNGARVSVLGTVSDRVS